MKKKDRKRTDVMSRATPALQLISDDYDDEPYFLGQTKRSTKGNDYNDDDDEELEW